MGGVLGFGQLGACDDLLIEVVVGDDRGLAVDVADMPSHHRNVGARVELAPDRNGFGWGDPGDFDVLPGRVVALALDVGFPGIRRRYGSVVSPLELR